MRKRDQYMITASKKARNGSSLLISLHFEDQTSGFCYYTIASDKSSTNDWIRKLIVDRLEMDDEKKLQHKKQLIQNPQLQGVFDLGDHLRADEIIDGIEEVSMQFMGQEEMSLRLLSADKTFYCFAENQCDELREQFRKNREGILYATKSVEGRFCINLKLHFKGKLETSGYYFIALRSPEENLAARDYILRLLSGREVEENELQLMVKPQFQDSFSFDNQLSVDELIYFLEQLSANFLQHEILTVRLTTVRGQHHYFYDDSLDDIRPVFRQNAHDLVYINLKEENGRSISIHLQFKSMVAGANGYFSIVMHNEEENMQVVNFIRTQLRTQPGLQQRKKSLPAIVNAVLPNAIEGGFTFNQYLDIKFLLSTLQQLSRRVLPGLQLEIQAVTLSGEEKYFTDQEFNRLDFLLYHKKVDYLFVKKGDDTGPRISLYLHFNSDHDRSGYYTVRLTTEQENNDASKFILNKLALDAPAPKLKGNLLKGNFHFPETISADRILAFLNSLVRKSLDKESFVQNKRLNFNLRHLDGRTHINLDYNAFRAIFIVERPSIHIVSVSSNTLSGKYVELAFVFEKNALQENGHFTISCGSTTSNNKVRDFILGSFPENVVPSKGSDTKTQLSEVSTQPKASAGKKKEKAEEDLKDKRTIKKPKSPSPFPLPPFMDKEYSVEKGLCLLSFGSLKEDKSELKATVLQTIENLGMTWVIPENLDEFNVLKTIWKAIRESEFVIADISDQSNSVFYELGLAHAFRKKLILLTSKPLELPFDFKQFKYIIYRDNEKGLKRLAAELNAYLEEG